MNKLDIYIRGGLIVAILNYQFCTFALFVSGFVYCAVNYNQLGTVYEESDAIMQFTLPEIWKLYAVLPCILARSSNEKISGFGCPFKNSVDDSKRVE